MKCLRRISSFALAASALCFAPAAGLLASSAVAQARISQPAHSGLRASTIPTSLACESEQSPLGVDAANPRFSWLLRPASDADRDVRQSAFQIELASSARLLANGRADVWDSGRTTSSDIFQIAYAGPALLSHSRYYWRVRVWDAHGQPSEWSPPAEFTTGLLHPRDWTANWIAAAADRKGDATPDSAEPDDSAGDKATKPSAPLPVFRHEFAASKKIAAALLFVSGMGQYEVRINGRNVTDAVLTPGWTDYRKRVLYDSYDVTSLLRNGPNAIGVMLGNGMYNVEGTPGRYTKFTGSFGQPKLILQLHLRYADGSTETIASDRSWKTAAGPIVFSSTYGGEDYDARHAWPGWDMPGFDDHAWSQALEVEGPGGILASERLPLIKVAQHLIPIKITEPRPGVRVYDLGQNFAGWPQIVATGQAGSSVKLLAGELLDKNGMVTQHSANASPAHENSFTYTFSGHGVERWHPRFSYYGFRYVQAELSAAPNHPSSSHPSGSQRLPLISRLSGESIHDAVRVSGQFSSSDQMFVKIHKLIDAAILSNMVSVLTDCPHREKLGWLEQTHLAGASIMYNYDVSLLYRKMADDMEDDQLQNGMVPAIAPEFVKFLDKNGNSTDFRDSPEWGSAVVLSAWEAYQFYGDLDNLRGHYDSMQRYIEYLRSRAKDHMLSYGLGDWYDIGPHAPGYSQLTGSSLTATAIYYQDLISLSKIASLLGKQDDASAYAKEADEVGASFNAHLFNAQTNQYDRGSQTANAMPLALGLVPEDHRAAVLANLVADIRQHGNHVTAGDVGFHYLVRALTDGGRSDVLYDMLSLTDKPSYGYQLAQGATTLTEAWDASPNSSQNHFMLGHAEEWFYRGLAGLSFDLSRPQDERIEIQPNMVGKVSSAAASLASVLGPIEASWTKDGAGDGARLHLHVSIPAGATATVFFPESYGDNITLAGKPLEKGNGIQSVHRERNAVHCVAGSGRYEFELGRSARLSAARNEAHVN